MLDKGFVFVNHNKTLYRICRICNRGTQMSGESPLTSPGGPLYQFTQSMGPSDTSSDTPSPLAPTSAAPAPTIQPSGTIMPDINNISTASYPASTETPLAQAPIPQYASAGQAVGPSNMGMSFQQAYAPTGKEGTGMGMPTQMPAGPSGAPPSPSPLAAIFGGKTSGGGPSG